MSDDIDIVKRLRSIWMPVRNGEIHARYCHQAADEIERLRAERDEALHGESVAMATLQGVIEERTALRIERDSARAEVCILRPSVCIGAQSAGDYARSRGWKDLFGEDAL